MTARVDEIAHWAAWCDDCLWYGPTRVERLDAVSDQRSHHDICPYAGTVETHTRVCGECDGFGYTTSGYDLPFEREPCRPCGGSGEC